MHTNILKALLWIVILGAGGFWHAPEFTQGVTEAERMLQRAMQTENVDGDLKAAIEQYRKILTRRDASRAVAAKALFRLGQCQEKLGNAEARKSYEQLVRDYADQTDLAVEARARLAALTKAAGATNGSTLAVRQVWAGRPGVDISGTVSPDGQYYVYFDWDKENIAFYEFATGNSHFLPKNDPQNWGGSAPQYPALSPDGSQIAFSCPQGSFSQLRIINREGTNARVLYPKQQEKNPSLVIGAAWSPDGKHILTLMDKKDGAWQYALIAVADGSVRILNTHPVQDSPARMRFSLDGRYLAYDALTKEGEERDIFLLSADGSRDIPLIQHPANDMVLGWAPDGKHLLFLSDRAGSMGAWFVEVSEGKVQGSPWLVMKDLGQIRPFGFARNGSFHYGISINMEDVHIATLDLAQGKVLIPPMALSRRIVGGASAPDWSPDGKYLAYVSGRASSSSQQNSPVITIRTIETGEERQLSPKSVILSYNLRWSPDGQSIVGRGFDDSRGQGAHVVSLKTGEVLASVLGPYWADWSRDGKSIVYAKNAQNGRPIAAWDLESRQERELYRGWAGLSLASSPDGRWLAFSAFDLDHHRSMLKVMPASGGEPRDLLTLADPEDFGPIVWTPDSRQLLFVRRNFSIGKHELWSISAQGGEPRRIGLQMHGVGQMSIHPDGQRIAFHKGETHGEIWVMENFLPSSKAVRQQKQ